MPSFQITISPKRRAAARYVAAVRRELQRALAREGLNGLTQSEVARRIETHRSVVSRELRGDKDLSQSRVGELAWAMGYTPVFRLEKAEPVERVNEAQGAISNGVASSTGQVRVLKIELEDAG